MSLPCPFPESLLRQSFQTADNFTGTGKEWIKHTCQFIPAHCLSLGIPSVWHSWDSNIRVTHPTRKSTPSREKAFICMPAWVYLQSENVLAPVQEARQITECQENIAVCCLTSYAFSGGSCWLLIHTGRYTSILIQGGCHKEDKITCSPYQESS